MSKADQQRETDTYESDWEELAEHEDTLEMLVDEETALEEEARTLLAELEVRGYR